MKSPMVENLSCIPNKSQYSELKVLMSAAGYYVGTTYNEYDDDGNFLFQEPGSRDSGYFATRAEAEALLKAIESDTDENAAMILRQTP